MGISPLFDRLVSAFRCLPGVGPKSAQRMAFYLLDRDRDAGNELAEALQQAMQSLGYCSQCRIYTEEAQCRFCRDKTRDPRSVCVVETPSDVLALEQTGGYRGYYFVLHGHLSPIDGIGPEDLGMAALKQRTQEDGVEEVILAINSTVEGEATSHYICELLRPLDVSVSRIAQGVPMGGELEYVDPGTLAHAVAGRTPYHD